MKNKLIKFGGLFALVLCFCAAIVFGGVMAGAKTYADESKPTDEAEYAWFGKAGESTSISKVYPTGGGYVVLENSGSTTEMVKYDETGAELWRIGNDDYLISSLVVADDGSIYTIGNAGIPGASQGYISRYIINNDNEAEEDWTVDFTDIAETTGAFDIYAYGIEVYGNEIIVPATFTGASYDIEVNGETETFDNFGTGENSLVFRFNNKGEVTFVKQYGGKGDTKITGVKALENGNFAISGNINNTSTGIPGLSTVSGTYVSFAAVLTYNQLFSDEYSAVWTQTILPASGALYADNLYVSGNVVMVYGFTEGVSANGSLGTWAANDALIFSFDGNTGRQLYAPIAIGAASGTPSCSGVVIDNDGNPIIINTVTNNSTWTYSKIVKYDILAGTVIWETQCGDQLSNTFIYGVNVINNKIMAYGYADNRFDDVLETLTGDQDGFIVTFDAFKLEVAAPAAAEGSYIYGNEMPVIVPGVSNIPGIWAWKEGSALLAGTKNYTCLFVPESKLIAPVEFEVSIPGVLKANRTKPTGTLTIKEKTSSTIELEAITIKGEVIQYRLLDKDGKEIKDIDWQESTLFEGLKSSTIYKAVYRIKSDSNYTASVESDSIEAKTDKGPSNLMFYILLIALVAFMFLSMISRRKKMAASQQGQRPRPPQQPPQDNPPSQQ